MSRFVSKEEEKLCYEYRVSKEELLNQYQKQGRPECDKLSLTIDTALMCYSKEEDQLEASLIQRKEHPYRNSWALSSDFVQKDEPTGESVLGETKRETDVVTSKENIEQPHIFSTPNRDPRGWVVIISYLAFIGEEPLIARDDAKEARWLTLERHSNKIHLFGGEVTTSLGSVTGESSDKGILAFNHSQITLRAFNRTVNKMEHEPQALQVLGKDFTITEARKVSVRFLGIDYKTIGRSNFKEAMFQYFDEIDERPVRIDRPSKIYQLKPGHHE